MNHIRHILMGVACMMSMAASAQWQWSDKDGHKVFSDRAPPLDVPEKSILKRPGGVGKMGSTADAAPNLAANAPATASTVSVPQTAASAPKPSGVDKDLADKKKKAEEAELAKRKAEEQKVLQAKVENCARAKQAKANFDSGIRIAQINANGEREVMDDAARAAEVKRIQSIIDTDCK